MIAKLFELRDKKLKENKKKGFTLVELIVVLVILAILAALLIPTLTGYINKAKEKSIIAETRQTVMAAQTLVDEYYGTLTLNSKTTISVEDKKEDTVSDSEIVIAKTSIADLAEVKADCIKSVTVENGKVTAVQYENQGKTCYYTAGATGEKGTYSFTAPNDSKADGK